MTREEFLEYCLDMYGTKPDYPFTDDLESAVLRHDENRKWYALAMKVSRQKLGMNSDETVDVVNLKKPVELLCPFDSAEGVYSAYHMNKTHWVSVILPDAPDDVVKLLVSVSFEATEKAKRR